jgi:hypothetical protein
MAFRAVLDKMTVAATSARSVYSSNIFSCYLAAAKTGPSVGREPQDVAVQRERYDAISFAPAYDPHHDARRPSSGRSNLSPDRPEVMKLG